ncbi:MAG: hypothetical protein CM1200mP2_39990 [Planctomycetaceae bacterium]|nr:MAG: hypothetical protein CM1200mP2_39990 [Planctomycetaceae bacterium]
MLEYFIKKSSRHGLLKPRVVIAVPGGITPVEKRAVFNSAEGGRRRTGLPDRRVEGRRHRSRAADLRTDGQHGVRHRGRNDRDAILSLAEIVVSRSIRIGGDEMDEAIVEYMKQHFSLRIGTQAAEAIKIEAGSAFPLDEERTAEVRVSTRSVACHGRRSSPAKKFARRCESRSRRS